MAEKILIIDDEPHILRLLASRLRANHYEVIAASNTSQGFRAASEEKPDLILLDIRMPGKDGLSLFDNLKGSTLTSDIPVIFITAYPQKNVRESVLALGAVDFIAKPFNADDLLKKVEKTLAIKPAFVKRSEAQGGQKTTRAAGEATGRWPTANEAPNKLVAPNGKPKQGMTKANPTANEEIEYLE
jgi:DNA-binding response OmpR family regulator